MMPRPRPRRFFAGNGRLSTSPPPSILPFPRPAQGFPGVWVTGFVAAHVAGGR